MVYLLLHCICFHLLAIAMLQWTSVDMSISVWILASSYLRYKFRNRISRSDSSVISSLCVYMCICNLPRLLDLAFWETTTLVYTMALLAFIPLNTSYWLAVLFNHQHVKGHLIVVLICTCLMTSDDQLLFICFLATLVIFFGKNIYWMLFNAFNWIEFLPIWKDL